MDVPFGKTHLLPAAIVIVGFIVIAGLSVFIEKSRPMLPEDYADSDLAMSGSRFKGFAFGMDGLMADWYYMRALQYIGDKIINSKSEAINIDDLRDLNPRLLYPLLDNATDLDPHFMDAYLYGAIIMPAIDPQQAIAIAEKGVANNPTKWKLYGPLGYIYWKLGNYEKASETYEKGSQVEGAPPFMKMMAAAMKTRGGSRETAREIYREMQANSEDDQVRITADRRLKQLDSLDEREAIDRVLADFKESNGRCADNFAEILPKLMTIKLAENHEFLVDRSYNLVDPTGVPYLLDKDKCRTQLDFSRSGIAAQ